MAHENQPDTEERAQTKSSQKSLLLLLVLVAVLYGYLYFFTGLIRPRPEAPPPQQAQTVVKKPLPPRGGEAGEAKGKKGEEEKVAAAKPGDKGAQEAPPGKGAKPAPAKAEKGAKPAVAKEEKGAKAPAKEAAAKVPAGKEAKESKPAVAAADKAAKAKAEKPAQPAAKAEKTAKTAPAAAKSAPAKPAAGKDAKGAVPAKTAVAAKGAPAKPEKGDAKPQATKAAASKAAPRGAYTLELAGDLAESEVRSVTAKLKKAGISGMEKTKMKKGEPMHRLFLADFANKDEAAEELQRLKQTAPDAFMLTENGRYAVYAGSYLREKKAALEQDRLYDKGVKLLLRTATAPVAVLKVRAGSFPNQASAEQALERLKKTGVDAKVVKTGK
ncbi:SPOR domain-containing protein [Geomesophilobacter sediminis]|uniref:SPOR domain-containing protein n=1 Tax=Geomesophilobacter sediminis TaxID=2798584 RepID=A0A8J7M2M5_9BACT|nr:SPOR domain-containing protein [Geomesophilobacter sediminis]MBJ6727550.1 SPOR domain-containing protein [Geomesophilobacter sediminis]